MSPAEPELSLTVVVIILGGADYLPGCLRALRQQVGVPPPDIIVPHDDALERASEFSREFPDIEFIPHDGRRTYAELRAAAVRRARGDIVAVTEDHCTPEPDWCANIIRLHRQPYAAVGGSVHKTGKDSLVNWAVYLIDFGRYMNPVPEGPARYLTDCNVSYKRRVLAEISQQWRDEFHETTVNWSLLDKGAALWLSPAVVVRQRRNLKLGYAISERYRFGRLFASTRVAPKGIAHRLVYAAFSPLLIVIFTGRVARNVITKRRAVRQFLLSLPFVVLLSAIWALGEFVGYMTAKAGRGLRPDPR